MDTEVKMMHNAQIAAWLVHTIGKTLGMLVGIPLLGAVFTFSSGEPFFLGLGGFVAVIAVLLYLTGVSPPYPSEELVALLDDEDAPDPDYS